MRILSSPHSESRFDAAANGSPISRSKKSIHCEGQGFGLELRFPDHPPIKVRFQDGTATKEVNPQHVRNLYRPDQPHEETLECLRRCANVLGTFVVIRRGDFFYVGPRLEGGMPGDERERRLPPEPVNDPRANRHNARRLLTEYIGHDPGRTHHAHHVISQKFQSAWQTTYPGTNIHSPQVMAFFESRAHLRDAYSYNQIVQYILRERVPYKEAMRILQEAAHDRGYVVGAHIGPNDHAARVRHTGLVSTFNQMNGGSGLILPRGGEREVGGVALSPGIIPELKDSMVDLLEQRPVFLMACSDRRPPFSDPQLAQILRELAVGIYLHNQLPVFSLHFNQAGELFPVIAPAYRDTRVGHVMGMLDYQMKGFLNGGMFTPDFVQRWLARGRGDTAADSADLLDVLASLHQSTRQAGRYMSLRELVRAVGVKEEDCGGRAFTSSFRIIANNTMRRCDLGFVLGRSFRVAYSIDDGASFAEEVARHRAREGVAPEYFRRLERAYDLMAASIEQLMPKLPHCRDMFNMLGAIDFFSKYFLTLKNMHKVPVFDGHVETEHADFPALLPPLPIRQTTENELSMSLQDLKGAIAADACPSLEAWLAACAAARREAPLPVGLAVAIARAQAALTRDRCGGEPLATRQVHDDATAKTCIAPWLTPLLEDFLRRCPEGTQDGAISRALVAGVVVKVITTRLDATTAGDRARPFRVVGGCGLAPRSEAPAEVPVANDVIAAAAEAIGNAPFERWQHVEARGRAGYYYFRLRVRPLGPGDAPFSGADRSAQTPRVSCPNAVVVAAGPSPDLLERMAANGGLARTDAHGQGWVHFAAAQGDVAWVPALGERGADWQTQDGRGQTPLHVAAYRGHTQMVEALLARGRDALRAKSVDGSCPVLAAILGGHLEIVQRLLAAGGDANGKLTSGQSALGLAICEEEAQMAELLIAHGAAVNVDASAPGDAAPPLHLAVGCDQPMVVAKLIEAGADVRAQRRDGATALHLAASIDARACAELLLARGADLDATCLAGDTPLLKASAVDAHWVAHRLLAAGADALRVNRHGQSAMAVALEACALNVAYLLLPVSNLDAPSPDGMTPVACAARLGLVGFVDALLRHGASPQATDKDGHTLAHDLCRHGHAELLVRYVQAGHIQPRDLHSCDQAGRTPYVAALEAGHELVIAAFARHDWPREHFLLPMGAAACAARHGTIGCLRTYVYGEGGDVNATVATPGHPLHQKSLATIAALHGHTHCLQLLLRAGAELTGGACQGPLGLLEGAIWGNAIPCIDLVLYHGPFAHNRAQMLGEAAIFAACGADLAVLKHLEAQGADLTHADGHGRTALHHAVSLGRIDVVGWLLERIPDQKLPADALYLAAQTGQLAVAQRLVAHGAPWTCPDILVDALHFAIETHHLEVAQALLAAGACPTERRGRNDALGRAAYVESVDALALLAEVAPDAVAGPSGARALAVAARRGHPGCVAFLMGRGHPPPPVPRQALGPSAPEGLHAVAVRLIAPAAQARDLEATLHRALRHDDAEALTRLVPQLSAHMRVDVAALGDCPAPGERRFLPLAAYLVSSGHSEVARRLLCTAEDFKPTCGHGVGVLARAAAAGDTETLGHGRRLGADFSVRDRQGRTLLHHAAVGPDEADTVGPLIEAGVDVAACDQLGRTCLHLAAAAGRAKRVTELLAAGLRADTACRRRRTPLFEAVEAGHLPACRAMLDGRLDVGLAGGFTRVPPICAAVAGGNVSLVTLLAAQGALFAARDVAGQAPGHYLSPEGALTMVRALLELDPIALKRQDYAALTPVHRLAAAGGEVAEYVIARAAHVDDVPRTPPAAASTVAVLPDRGAMRPIERAALAGQLGTVRALWCRGAEVNGMDASSRDLLWFAAAGDAVEVLDEVQGYRHFDMTSQMDAACAAVVHRAERTAAALIGTLPVPIFARDGTSAITLSARLGVAGATAHLLARGASPHGDGCRADSPLVAAVTGGHLADARLLLGAGAAVDQRDVDGRPLLNVAVDADSAPMVLLLLLAGADAEACDLDGGSAAARAARHGRLDILTLLSAWGATLPADGPSHTPAVTAALTRLRGLDAASRRAGDTPLHRAVRHGHRHLTCALAHSEAAGTLNRNGQRPTDLTDDRAVQVALAAAGAASEAVS